MRRSACWAYMFALATGACADAPQDVDQVDVGSTSQGVVNGTTTAARPEVGRINGCTATLITPRHFVTAAHCISYEANRTVAGDFTIGTNTYAITRITAFSDSAGADDVALGRLATAVPANVATPAILASVQPSGGTATVIGYGCNDRSPIEGGGTKRFAEFTWGSATTRLCYGDSGGPVFAGRLADRGVLIGVNSGHTGSRGDESGTDFFADPTRFKQRIEQTIRNWEGGLEVGIDRPGLDLRNFSSTSAVACRTECDRDASCRAFSYVTSTSRCWLKRGVPEAVPNGNVTSGLPSNVAVFDRPGSDYTNYVSPSADACRQDCAADSSRCVTFTYVTSNQRCWLKNAVPSVSTCSTCRTGTARGLENGVDRPGRDYLTVSLSSARACADRCASEDRCEAFTWVDADDTCFLKDEVPATGSLSGAVSGVRRGWEINVNRSGQDLRSFVVSVPEPRLCQAACAREGQCRAWTLVTDAVAGENRCWLKSAVPGASSAFGMISGTRGAEFF